MARKNTDEIVSIEDILIKNGKSVLKIKDKGLNDFQIVNTSIRDKEGVPCYKYALKLDRSDALLYYYLYRSRSKHISQDELIYISKRQKEVKSEKQKEENKKGGMSKKREKIVEEFDKELNSYISGERTVPIDVLETEWDLQRDPFANRSSSFNKGIAKKLFPYIEDEAKISALAGVIDCFKKYENGGYFFYNKYIDNGTEIIPFDIEGEPSYIYAETNSKVPIIEVYGIRDNDELMDEENLNTDANSIIDEYKPNISIGVMEDVEFDSATAMIALGDMYDIALLTGKIGSGKTTFLKSIIAQRYSNLKEWYIDAKHEIRGQNGSIFDCILGSYVKNKNDGSQVKRIKEAINGIDQQVLIMVDNYDSLNEDEIEKVVSNLKELHKNCCGKLKTIIAGPHINISTINDALNMGDKRQYSIIEIQMQPLRSDSIEKQGVYISDPTPLQAIVANSLGISDDHIINGSFELYDSYYNATLADQSERVKAYTKYVAWKLMNSDTDGWPDLNNATDDFPCVFRGMSLPGTEDNFLNFLRNRKLVSYKESRGAINENEITFEDVEGQCYLAAQLIADELCRGGWKEIQKLQEIVNKLNTYTMEDVINSSIHIYGEYLFRELCRELGKRKPVLDEYTKESILRLGLASGYYSKNDLLPDIVPLINEYIRNTDDTDIKIISEINDYLYEILARKILNEKSENSQLREKALTKKLQRATGIEDVFIKLADRINRAIFDQKEISVTNTDVMELCEGNGSLSKIASNIRDGKYNFKLLDSDSKDSNDDTICSLDEDATAICKEVKEALDSNNSDSLHVKVSMLSVIYGNTAAASLEIGTRCGIKNDDDSIQWIEMAEKYHEMGRRLRMVSTGSISRSFICLGTDNYYLSKKGRREDREDKLEKAEEYAEKAIRYALASEKEMIKERIACGSVTSAIEKAKSLNLNDDIVIACKNRLGCVYELKKDNYIDAVQVSKALIDTNECIEKYCKQKGNHIAFIQAPVEDLIKRTVEEFLPFIEDQESKMKRRIGLSPSNRPKEAIDIRRVRSSLEKLCENYNELRAHAPIYLDVKGRNIGILKNC